MFEPYWRPVTSEPGGGLGLRRFACKQIVTTHGGALDLKSAEARGFTLLHAFRSDARLLGAARHRGHGMHWLLAFRARWFAFFLSTMTFLRGRRLVQYDWM